MLTPYPAVPQHRSSQEGIMDTDDTGLADLIAAPFLLIVSLIFLYNMDIFIDVGLPSVVSPRTFPGFIVVCIAVLSLLFCFFAAYVFLKKKTAARPPADPAAAAAEAEDLAAMGQAGSARGFLSYILILYAYRYLMEYCGFLIATPLAMAGVAWLLHGRRWHILLPSFGAFAFALDYMTFHCIRIALPLGKFFE